MELIFGFWTNFFNHLIFIVWQSVEGKNGKLIINIDFVVSSIFEGRFNYRSIISISWMLIIPKLKQKIVVVLFVLGKRSVIVVLAIVIAKGQENRSVR